MYTWLHVACESVDLIPELGGFMGVATGLFHGPGHDPNRCGSSKVFDASGSPLPANCLTTQFLLATGSKVLL
jgi:hypothetical protein